MIATREARTDRLRIFLLTSLALVAFASNSVLCRMALGADTIDAASFTTIRLISGAVMLVLIRAMFSKRSESASRASWRAALMLFLYAIAFSFAYISLNTGTGALILFGAVQLTMIVAGLMSGERNSSKSTGPGR